MFWFVIYAQSNMKQLKSLFIEVSFFYGQLFCYKFKIIALAAKLYFENTVQGFILDSFRLITKKNIKRYLASLFFPVLIYSMSAIFLFYLIVCAKFETLQPP